MLSAYTHQQATFRSVKNKKISNSTIKRYIDYLCDSFLIDSAIRYDVKGKKYIDNYFEKFVIFLNEIRTNDRMPTDKDFEHALIYKQLYKKNICKYLLSVIENSSKEHIDVSNLTIEHILPQKENAAVWKKEIGDSYGHVYEVYLHTLGNLTITGHNSELGTKAFSEKKKIIKENSKANILNRDVISAEKWNEEAILNRAKRLAKILTEEFKYIDLHSYTNEDTKC